MELSTLWFILVAVLWIGYFVLEGFDFGVGMLVTFLGKKEDDRRVMINTIGPVWDGNEVWLLTAGGATFAAFPEWYATLFSGLYLPLFLILLALIARGVAFEYRQKRKHMGWKRTWDWSIFFGSLIPALVFGVGFANFVRGLPIEMQEGRRWIMETNVPNFLGLFLPYALIGGVLFVTLFLMHGAIFISLKTSGEIRQMARGFAGKIGLAVAVLMAAHMIWTAAVHGKGISWVSAVIAIVGVVAAWFANSKGRESWAFTATCVAIANMMVTYFTALFPYAIKALDPAHHMLAADAASSALTLKIMTISALVAVPIVLAYQAWTFWVFRKRISVKNLPVEEPEPSPAH